MTVSSIPETVFFEFKPHCSKLLLSVLPHVSTISSAFCIMLKSVAMELHLYPVDARPCRVPSLDPASLSSDRG